MKVGVRLGSLGTGSLRKDLQRVLAIGVHGIGLRTAGPELAPEAMPNEKREELADYIESFGFELPAVTSAWDPASDEGGAAVREGIDFCASLRAPLFVLGIGSVPHGSRFDDIAARIRDLAQYASASNVRLALTAFAPMDDFLAVMNSVGDDSVRVDFDPSRFTESGQDALEALRRLASLVVHVHANSSAADGSEIPLSQGEKPFATCLNWLRETGYDGFITVARDRDEDLAAFVVEDVTWLKRQDGIDP